MNERYVSDFLRRLLVQTQEQTETINTFLSAFEGDAASPRLSGEAALMTSKPTSPAKSSAPMQEPTPAAGRVRVHEDFPGGWGITYYEDIDTVAKDEGGAEMPLQYRDGTFRTFKNGLQYRYYDQNGKQCSIYGLTKRDCWLKRNKLEHGKDTIIDQKNETKGFTVGNATTYGEWSEEWLRLYKEPAGLKTGYLKNIRGYLKNYILPAFADIQLRNIKTLMLQEFLVNVKSDCTRTKLAAVLSESLRDAMAVELIDRNPYEGVRFKRYEPPELGALTHAEQQLLLDAVDTSRLGDGKMPTFTRLLLMTGMRQGEANAIRVRDVDFENHEISVLHTYDRFDKELVKPKTRAGKRIVPMSAPLEALLRPLVNLTNDPEARIFGYEGSYTPRYYGKIFKQLGLTFSGHITRHTFITNAYEMRFPPYVVKRWVGHSDIKQADVYLELRKPSEWLDTEITEYMKLLKSENVWGE